MSHSHLSTTTTQNQKANYGSCGEALDAQPELEFALDLEAASTTASTTTSIVAETETETESEVEVDSELGCEEPMPVTRVPGDCRSEADAYPYAEDDEDSDLEMALERTGPLAKYSDLEMALERTGPLATSRGLALKGGNDGEQPLDGNLVGLLIVAGVLFIGGGIVFSVAVRRAKQEAGLYD